MGGSVRRAIVASGGSARGGLHGREFVIGRLSGIYSSRRGSPRLRLGRLLLQGTYCAAPALGCHSSPS
jgi:hypothetical protein